MKRLTIILAGTVLTAISVLTAARAQTGCAWWDLTCNGLASMVNDYGWHIAGREPAGNVVYLRRRVDSNGNVIFEQARRNDFGRYLVLNNYTLRKGTVYGANGEICKYSSNAKGYKEECKYAKPYVVKPSKVYTARYEAPKPKPVKYGAPKVHTEKYKTPKPKDFSGVKDKDVKGKGPKH